MKVILFGGTGFIGKAILSSAWINDYTVVVVSRTPPTKKTDEAVEYIPYDSDKILSHFKDEYGIINLAGAGIGDSLWTPRRKGLLLESRLAIALLISELVKKSKDKPLVILQASAVGYYGSQGHEVLTEKSSKGQGFLADLCFAWEGALSLEQSLKTRLVFLRTGLVLASDGGMLPKLALSFRLFMGGYFGNGKQWMPWIHIADEVSAIKFLLEENKAKGPYNLVAPNPVQMKILFWEFGKKLRRSSWLHLPAFVIRLLPGGFGEELLLVSQKVKPEKLINQGFKFQFEQLESALNELYPHE